MGAFDLILLAILVFGAVKGYMHGFIIEVFSFFSFFVSLVIALELTIPIATKFFGSSSYFEVIAVVVFIAIFLSLSIVIKIGTKFLKNVVDRTLLGKLDNVAGAIAGLFKWAFILSIIFWVFESVGFDLANRYVGDTLLFPYIVSIGPTVFEWTGDILPFIHDLIDSMENFSKNKTIKYALSLNEIMP